MRRSTKRWLCALSLTVALVMLTTGGRARAGEEDDLQRQIETQRAGVNDLERLDELRTTTDEITLLKAWLDEAWALRSKHEYDQVREVLDRCIAQAELVRQKISAGQAARAVPTSARRRCSETRAKIDADKKALADTQSRRGRSR